jgi:hypothetical protein
VVCHLRLRQQLERLLRLGLRVGDLDNAKELLLDRDRGMAVVNPPFVAVRQGNPLDAGDGCVREDLAGPLPIIDMRP